MYKKHKKKQNTDPAFNSYLLLNGLKKKKKKKKISYFELIHIEI